MSGLYDVSMRAHEGSAQRHETAAALWDTRNEAERAEFERRCARIEREAARLDADRSELERLRPSRLAQPHAAGRAEIDRLSAEIKRRSAQLQADDAAVEQERARLWPPEDSREHQRATPAEKAPIQRDIATSEDKTSESQTAERTLGASGRVAAQTRKNARHMSSVLSQTADVLEKSAALAAAHAERLERAGRADAGAEERRAADRARKAAQRARSRAEEWLEVIPGRPH